MSGTSDGAQRKKDPQSRAFFWFPLCSRHSRTRLPALVVGRRGIELPDGLFLECRRRGQADAWMTRLGMKVKHWGETLLLKKYLNCDFMFPNIVCN